MKNNLKAVILSLAIVLCLSLGVGGIIFLTSTPKTYLTSYCQNERIAEDMTRNQIAKVYSPSCVVVHCSATDPTKRYSLPVFGSGVCIAAKGFQAGEYTASKGMYFATNYHVVSFALDPLYSQYTTKIQIETSVSSQRYDAQLLWANKDLDVAVVYCDESFDFGWINMKDRLVFSEDKDKPYYEDIFVIGTPRSVNYKNTLTLGNISNNNFQLLEVTADDYYSYNLNGELKVTNDKEVVSGKYSYVSRYTTHRDFYDNVYENTVLMNCDIAGGNSGGGVFDCYGNLIGLATLGKSVDYSGSAAMNFMVPVYPIMQVLNKLIIENETGTRQTIYTMEKMKFVGIDSYEAMLFKSNIVSFDYYLFDGQLYDVINYDSAFQFSNYGVYVVESETSNFTKGSVITGMSKNGTDFTQIDNRNDLIFFLLNCNEGEKIYVSSNNGVYTINL